MIRRAVSVAVGLAITAAALWYLITPEVMREFQGLSRRANWPELILATVLTGIVQWLRAWRFAIMTNNSLALPELPLVRIAFQLNFLNFTLPFRLGELGYPLMMKRTYGQAIASALGVLLLARLFDLFTVTAIFLFLAGLLGLSGMPPLLLVAGVLFALAPLMMGYAARGLRQLLPRKGGFGAALERALAALGARRTQLGAILVSYAIWLLFGGLAAIAAHAVTENIPPAVAMLGAAAGNIAFALPVNGIGGLGASQAAWAFAVNWAGVPWEDAVISAFALYAVTLAGALLFGGVAIASRAGR
jgi:hypothetical protein